MRIYRPGMPVTYIDEEPPKSAHPVEGNPLPSVEAAIAAAQARQAQILNYTRSSPPIDPVNPTPNGQNPVSVPVTDQASIEAQIAALQAQLKPHSVNSNPEVSE